MEKLGFGPAARRHSEPSVGSPERPVSGLEFLGVAEPGSFASVIKDLNIGQPKVPELVIEKPTSSTEEKN